MRNGGKRSNKWLRRYSKLLISKKNWMELENKYLVTVMISISQLLICKILGYKSRKKDNI